MKITVTSIIRIANSETFAPVETAVVSSAGVRAMHRDGGYYVFVTPFAANSSIDISCDGYSPISIVACEKRTAYLKPLHTVTVATQLYVSEYDADNRALAIISADGDLPFVLEESFAAISDERVRIVGYDRGKGVLTLEKAFKKKPSKGQSIIVSAE